MLLRKSKQHRSRHVFASTPQEETCILFPDGFSFSALLQRSSLFMLRGRLLANSLLASRLRIQSRLLCCRQMKMLLLFIPLSTDLHVYLALVRSLSWLRGRCAPDVLRTFVNLCLTSSVVWHVAFCFIPLLWNYTSHADGPLCGGSAYAVCLGRGTYL